MIKLNHIDVRTMLRTSKCNIQFEGLKVLEEHPTYYKIDDQMWGEIFFASKLTFKFENGLVYKTYTYGLSAPSLSILTSRRFGA